MWTLTSCWPAIQASAAQLSATVGHGKTTSLASINLAGYYPGWAARQFALITSFARHRCMPFTTRDEITGARVEMRPSVAVVPGLGDQALLIKIIQANGPLPDGTYYPGDYLLVARVGDYLADVDAPAFPGRSPARAVRSVVTALAGQLAGWAELGCGAPRPPRRVRPARLAGRMSLTVGRPVGGRVSFPRVRRQSRAVRRSGARWYGTCRWSVAPGRSSAAGIR